MENKTAAAFNEWMRRFIETPEQFGREFQTVRTFLKEQSDGVVPSYGDVCAAYLEKLISEV